jgi:hypothetical protein
MQKTKRPPGGGRGDRLFEGLGAPSVDPTAPAAQGEIFVPHTEYAAVRVSKSRDGNRINVEILLKQRGMWLPRGVTPSFPTSMLDSVIAGLVQMRDRRGGGR